nr:hypothetical protein [Oscillospiraceae bacterium]
MKRTISMLMCAVMLFTLSPFSFAEEATDVETIVTEMPAEGVPSEDVAEVPAEEVIVPEESGASDASPEPAAVTAPAEPTAEAAKPQTVRIVFICEPETAVVKVFDGAQQNEDENPLLLVPEEDGSYLLKEGEYLYDAAAEGYVFIEKEAFQVEAPETEEEVPEERKQEIRVTMSPVEVPVAAPLPFPLTEAEPEETAEPVALPEEPAEESPTTPAGIWIPSGAGLMPGLETTTAPADETVTEEPEEEPAVGAAGKESAEEPTAEAAFVEEPAE